MKETPASVPIEDCVQVDLRVVCCDGCSSDDPLGHPLIYLNMGEGTQVTCPYCSRQFLLVEQKKLKG